MILIKKGDVKVGDRINCAGLFGQLLSFHQYAPYHATVTKLIGENGFGYKLDGYPYNGDDGNSTSWAVCKMYKFTKLHPEYKYEPSQEGDKEDDI